jgi:hypothetical protein
MAATTDQPVLTVPPADDRWSFRHYLVVSIAFIALYIGMDVAPGGPVHNADADDLLRALEVWTFLQTGRWFDMSLPMVHGQMVYVSAWSRLVDLPYAAIALVLRQVMSPEAALQAAFRIWPPAMGGLFALLLTATFRQIAPLKRQLPVSTLIAALVLMPYAIWEFSPGRIDHHSVQILLLLTIAYGLSRFDVKGGLAVGIAVPVAAAVGLETLPLLATALLALTLAWWIDMPGGGKVLAAAGGACALATLVLTLALIRPSDYFVAHNDVFSAPYVQALLAFGFLAMVLPRWIAPGRATRLLRITAFAGLGLVALAAIIVEYPDLLRGPFVMIDTLAKLYWFDRIPQEMTALMFLRSRIWIAIGLFVAMLAILLGTAPAALRHVRQSQPALPALFLFALAAFVGVCVSNRSLRLALALVPLLLPVALGEAARLLAGLRQSSARLGKAAGVAAALALASIALFVAVSERPTVPDAYDYLLFYDCNGEDFSPIARLAPARVLTPPGIGLRIAIQHAPGIVVSSIPFHRAAPGVSQVVRLFMAPTLAERTALLKGFNYLAVCRSKAGLPRENELPLYAAMMANKPVEGLELIATPKSSSLLLYRIIPPTAP